MDAIDDNDINKFDKIRNCRNELAHEMVNFISKGPKNDFLPLFREMTDLLKKIERWWIVNIEIPTNPDLNGEEIDKGRIVPGQIMVL